MYLTDCRALTADRFLLLPELVGDNRGLGTSTGLLIELEEDFGEEDRVTDVGEKGEGDFTDGG